MVGGGLTELYNRAQNLPGTSTCNPHNSSSRSFQLEELTENTTAWYAGTRARPQS